MSGTLRPQQPGHYGVACHLPSDAAVEAPVIDGHGTAPHAYIRMQIGEHYGLSGATLYISSADLAERIAAELLSAARKLRTVEAVAEATRAAINAAEVKP